jgi:hypothetical protein
VKICKCLCPTADTEDLYIRNGDTWRERSNGNYHMHPPCLVYHKGAMCPIPKEQLELFR